MQDNLTSSDALSPWKRGEIPAAHWPGVAERVEVIGREAPAMKAPIADVPGIAVERDVHRATRDATHAFRTDVPNIELDEDDSTRSFQKISDELAYRLEEPHAPRYPDQLVLDDLADEDELDDLDLADDEHVLGEDDIAPVLRGSEPANDYIPALLGRTRGTLVRVASKALIPAAAIALIVIAMGGTWSTAGATPAPQWSATTPPAAHATPIAARTLIEPDGPDHPAKKSNRKDLAGKLNLNTASEDQLMLLPTVGPSKAERIVTWRKKNGGFKRTADLRRVKGFGYKTFKKLEPFLDIKGDTTLAAK
jgi:competence ComEA-like helix-hairpin-helix protein